MTFINGMTTENLASLWWCRILSNVGGQVAYNGMVRCTTQHMTQTYLRRLCAEFDQGWKHRPSNGRIAYRNGWYSALMRIGTDRAVVRVLDWNTARLYYKFRLIQSLQTPQVEIRQSQTDGRLAAVCGNGHAFLTATSQLPSIASERSPFHHRWAVK